ncbi:hypothetical protein ABTF87_19355, partial [Acinetobacter baumannii]
LFIDNFLLRLFFVVDYFVFSLVLNGFNGVFLVVIVNFIFNFVVLFDLYFVNNFFMNTTL